MEITEFQQGLMKHALGANDKSDRNWFGTDLGCKDSEEFEKLVKGGYATKHTPPSWMGDDVIYRVTPKGWKSIHLCTKD